MAITIDDFSKIWASTSPLTPYEFSKSNYKEGWNFIGGTPPSRQMWDFLQKQNDEKAQYLLNNFGNYLPLSGGTITGDLDVTGNITGNVTGNVTGNADTATNATNDSNGDKIDTTYMPIAGGTFTGDVNGVTPPNGDNSKKLANTEFIQALANILTPTGCVQAFAGSATPNGWLLCDGSAVSRTDYADLYAVIGDTYGAGDGNTTFNLPNLVDKFVEGSATAGTEKSAGLPNITSKSTDYKGVCCWSGNSTPKQIGAIERTVTDYRPSSGTMGTFQYIDFDASRSSSIYGNSATVQPPALTMQYIIKY